MKKIFVMVLAFVMCLGLVACGSSSSDGVSQEEYDALQSNYDVLQSDYDKLQSDYDSLVSDTNDSSEDDTEAQPAASEEEPSPSPSPSLSPEEQLAQEEEFKASCVTYTYEEVSRDPDNYLYQPAYFRGKVIQVMEGNGYNVYRFNVSEGKYTWSDTIYVEYIPEEGASRILEDDIIDVYGLMMGLKTYETVLGGSVSIPYVIAAYIDISQ